MPVEELSDPRRVHPPLVAGEREMLESWLDFHRITLLLKCEGLDAEQRKQRPIPTSLLSLHGLIRHMADVERNWFSRVLETDHQIAPLYWSLEDPDADMNTEDASWDDDLAGWEAECAASRANAARHELDDTGRGIFDPSPVSLRWIYVHMIEEYARHNGHADLIREMIDGAVGD